MSSEESRAIVSLSLLAAFADGDKHDRERAEIKRIAEGLAGADSVNLPTLYRDVLMKHVTLASVIGALRSTESKQLAYEMAVCVCDADGVQSMPEQAFWPRRASRWGWMQPLRGNLPKPLKRWPLRRWARRNNPRFRMLLRLPALPGRQAA